MNFTDAYKVQSAIQMCDQVERVRGANRAKINNQANGAPPLSADDAAKMGLRVNFNDCSMAVLFQHGRRQYTNAFLSRNRFFKVRIPDAPEEHKLDWETQITALINKPMKRSRAYYETQRSQWASVLAHGFAPKIWPDADCWRPKFIALEDFRVQTDTECSLEDLPWFAVREAYTEGKLSKKVYGPEASSGWKKPACDRILSQLHNQLNSAQPNQWQTAPEKMAELVKQNGGYYASDAAPKAWLWHFYFYDDSDPNNSKWKLRVVVDATATGNVASSQDFLYDDGDTEFAPSLDQILHMQFGDLNNKAPFLLYSVRSLGFLLMEPCYWSNITTLRAIQHCLENMNAWLRIDDPAGRGRAQTVELMNKGILPAGVTIVPQAERHQINTQVLEVVQDRLKMLMDQASVSYTQDSQGQQSPDETATAVMARVSSVNAMMSGLLATAFNYAVFEYREICRRFCRKGSNDKDVIKFREQVLALNIPEIWLNSEKWEVEPEMPIGNGNPTMEQVQINQLMSARTAFSPEAQNEILHEFVTSTTGDPRRADAWVPLNKALQMTQAQEYAELVFSTLMLGVPTQGRSELNPVEQVEVLIGLMAGVIARIESTTNMATPAELAGFAQTEQFIQGLIQRIGQDPANIPVAKDASDKMGKLSNTVKGFEQRAQQAAQAAQQNGQNGNDGGAAAKVASAQITATATARIKEAEAAQKMHHKETQFVLGEKRKDEQTLAQIERDKAKNLNEIASTHLPSNRVAESISYPDAPASIQAQIEQQAGLTPAPASERKEKDGVPGPHSPASP